MNYILFQYFLFSEELNLPIICLPYGMSFSQISKIVNGELLENYDIQTKKALDIHRTFFDISLKERGLSKIAQTLVSTISNPVILMDQAFNVLDFYDIYGMDPELYYVPVVLFIRFPPKKGVNLIEEKKYKESVIFKILYFLEY